jgi:hypothetical protein
VRENKEKSRLEGMNFRMNGLKETSSTQSAENLPKRIPFYIKNRIKNNVNNINNINNCHEENINKYGSP